MNFMVLDTETSSAKDDRGVVEIGWVCIDADWCITEKVNSLIDPQQPISPSASGVHGLVYEDVANSPTLEEFFTLNEPGCYGKRIEGPVVLIGHRIGFDRPAVEPYVDGEIYELDTLRYARLLYPDADDHKLSSLKYLLNLPRDSGAAHRALADVLTAYHLARHIAERMNLSLLELAEHAKQPMLVKTASFGKHKGQPFSEIPRSYLQWMKRELSLDIDTQHTVDTLLGIKK